jgi:O-antigen/teichoic acid export membrane protein
MATGKPGTDKQKFNPMLANLKLTIKNSLIYGLGNVSLKITGLILIPIYTNTKFLSLEEYGVLGMLEILAQLSVAIIELSLNQSLTRWYWDPDSRKKQRSMFFTVLMTILGMAVLLNTLLFPSKELLSGLLFSNSDKAGLIQLMFLSATFDVLVGTIQTQLKLQQKAGLFTVTNIMKLLVTLGMTILLIIHFHHSVDAIFIGQISGSLVFILLLLPNVLKNLEFRFEKQILKEMLVYSYPLIIASVSAILLNTFDRYFLNYYSDLKEVGLYSLGFKIANTVKVLIVMSVQMAVSPILFQMMNAPERYRFYSKYMTYFAFVTMFMVLGLSLFGREIIKVITIDRAYWESFKIMPLIGLSIFFSMLKDTSLLGLQIAKKSKIVSTVVVLITMLNLGLNFILTPVLGMYGASLSSLLAQAAFFIVIYRIAQKHYPIPYEIGKIMILFFTGTLLLFVSYIPGEWNAVLRILIKTVVLVSFPFILYVVGFYEKIELIRLKEFYRKWKNLFQWKQNLDDVMKNL